MKILKISLIVIFITVLLSQNVFAIGKIFNTAESFEAASKNYTNYTMDTDKLQKGSGEIYNILLAIATGVAVIVGAIMAVKFMTAGVDKRVEVKESLFPYLISCIVVFGSMGIWKLVVTILSDF